MDVPKGKYPVMPGSDGVAVQEKEVTGGEVTEDVRSTCWVASPGHTSCGNWEKEVKGTGCTVTLNVVVSPSHPLAEATTLYITTPSVVPEAFENPVI